jgi:hypothetical protein
MFLRQWWAVGSWRQVGAGMIMIRWNASRIWAGGDVQHLEPWRLGLGGGQVTVEGEQPR